MIIMCKVTKCPFKVDCYRFCAVPRRANQTYFDKVPVKTYWSAKDGRVAICKDFMPNDWPFVEGD
jgi:hypothetical protein